MHIHLFHFTKNTLWSMWPLLIYLLIFRFWFLSWLKFCNQKKIVAYKRQKSEWFSVAISKLDTSIHWVLVAFRGYRAIDGHNVCRPLRQQTNTVKRTNLAARRGWWREDIKQQNKTKSWIKRQKQQSLDLHAGHQ